MRNPLRVLHDQFLKSALECSTGLHKSVRPYEITATSAGGSTFGAGALDTTLGTHVASILPIPDLVWSDMTVHAEQIGGGLAGALLLSLAWVTARLAGKTAYRTAIWLAARDDGTPVTRLNSIRDAARIGAVLAKCHLAFGVNTENEAFRLGQLIRLRGLSWSDNGKSFFTASGIEYARQRIIARPPAEQPSFT